MRGTHLLAELAGCQNKMCLVEKPVLEKEFVRLVKNSGLQILHSYFYQFMSGSAKAGVTGVVVLAESHITVHTWPESDGGYTALDVFVCNYEKDNSKIAHDLFEKLVDLFSPEHKETKIIER